MHDTTWNPETSVYDTLKSAFVDLLDGTDGWKEIQRTTGLPKERCQQIYNLFQQIKK